MVQRILRRSKPHVTKEGYIKAFDSDVIAAMRKMEETIVELRSSRETNKRQGHMVNYWSHAGEVAERLKAAVC